MTMGPVFHFELVRLARRGRFFVFRFLFGLVLLGTILVNYFGVVVSRSFAASGPSWSWSFTIDEAARFGRMLFATLMATQAALVLGLTPAMVADAIASERHRKTLQDLLTSRLSGGEIVLGKLLARLLAIGTYLLLLLPITSLLTLLGGIAPEGLLLGDLATASTAYLVAALAIFASVQARRPRDAVGAAYLLLVTWLWLPTLLTGLAALAFGPSSELVGWLDEGLRWAWPASPLALVADVGALFSGSYQALRDRVVWMVASQSAWATALVALAAWRLRPASRREVAPASRRSGAIIRGLRLFPRPPIGDAPIYWKEAFVGRGGGVVRALARLLGLATLAMIVLYALYASLDAFREVWAHGYGAEVGGLNDPRESFNWVVRGSVAGLLGLWLIWLGNLEAGGVALEREQDTWSGLLATPMDGDEILRGKMLGPLRATILFPATILGLLLLGLAAGAIHPAGFVLAALAVATAAAFVVGLGTFASLQCRTAWRAQAWTLGILIGPHVCCLLPIPSLLMLAIYAPLSYTDFRQVVEAIGRIDLVHREWPALVGATLIVGYIALGAVLYVGGSFVLIRGAFRGFDVLADRPRRLPTRAVDPGRAFLDSKPKPPSGGWEMGDGG